MPADAGCQQIVFQNVHRLPVIKHKAGAEESHHRLIAVVGIQDGECGPDKFKRRIQRDRHRPVDKIRDFRPAECPSQMLRVGRKISCHNGYVPVSKRLSAVLIRPGQPAYPRDRRLCFLCRIGTGQNPDLMPVTLPREGIPSARPEKVRFQILKLTSLAEPACSGLFHDKSGLYDRPRLRGNAPERLHRLLCQRKQLLLARSAEGIRPRVDREGSRHTLRLSHQSAQHIQLCRREAGKPIQINTAPFQHPGCWNSSAERLRYCLHRLHLMRLLKLTVLFPQDGQLRQLLRQDRPSAALGNHPLNLLIRYLILIHFREDALQFPEDTRTVDRPRKKRKTGCLPVRDQAEQQSFSGLLQKRFSSDTRLLKHTDCQS